MTIRGLQAKRRRWLSLAGGLLLATGCGAGNGGDTAPVLVLSAFPAELAPILERVEVAQTREIDGRPWRLGRIGTVSVVVGLTGIGLVNAARSTQAVLDEIAVRAVVFSGVAGSPRRIGDVVVAERWRLPDGTLYPADAELLTLAAAVASADDLAFERCTVPPAEPNRAPVCLAHRPELFVGGSGESDDPFAGAALPCQPEGGDVFGCDVADPVTGRIAPAPFAAKAAPADEPAAVDMESAAAAREARRRDIPFIAFRAVSDGSGDPLGLPGFPEQFFTYYRLAARNAAVATLAFLDALHR